MKVRGGEDVKRKFVLLAVVTCLAVMSVTPALTASRQIQDQSRHARLLHQRDAEITQRVGQA